MVNKVILIGRAGRDPEVRHLDSGVTVARFSIATDERYKNRNGERTTQTEWHNLVIWRQLAELAEKLIRKGSLIYVEGKLRSRQYEDNAGVKKYTTEIEVDTFQLLERKADDASERPSSPYQGNASNSNSNSNSSPAPESASFDAASDGPDDLPF